MPPRSHADGIPPGDGTRHERPRPVSREGGLPHPGHAKAAGCDLVATFDTVLHSDDMFAIP
jgi:hypothetical protein